MKLAALALLATLATLLVAACGDDGGGAAADGIRGITWTTSEIVTGGAPAAMPAGVRLELTLGNDGRLGARAGCNSMSGTYKISGGRLDVDGLGQTEMGCAAELMANDTAIASLLSSRPAVVLAGDTLTLTGSTSALRLVDLETVDPGSPLVGTTWVLDTLLDRDVASTIPQELRGKATLAFDTERVAWTSGCNSFGAGYQMDKGVLGLGETIATTKGCSEPEKSLEERIATVLGASPKLVIVRHRLTITAPNGQGLGFGSG